MMMSVLLRVLWLVLFISLAACSGGSGEGGISGTGGAPNIHVQGIAEKGPFLKRSEVSYKYIDAQGQTRSEYFSTETTDNLGNFSLGLQESGLISIRVEGYHFNELNGLVSDGLLVLKAIFEASDDEDQQAYVNILTHLISDRVLKLLQTTDLSTHYAIAQAEQELLSELDSAIPKISINDFSQLSIYNRSGQNEQGNAYLLLLSAALYQHALNNTVSGGSQTGELTNILNDLADDFIDGDLEASSAILDGLILAIQQLDPAGVITNLENRSNEVLGQKLEVPDFSQFIGQFIITYPAAESELSDITTIRTEVPSGLKNVTLDLMVDGLVVDSTTEAPYEFTWNPYYWSSESTSRHTLLVKARNSFGDEIISNLVPVSVLPSSRDQLSLTSPPDGQSLTNIKQTTLMWNSLAGTNAYQTQVASDSSFSTTIHDSLVNENQYLATSLKVGSYFWRTRGIDDSGNTGNWSEVNRFNIVSPEAPALSAPINSLAIRDTDRPSLSWENVTNAESYVVQVSQLSDFSTIVQQQVTTSTEWTTMHLDAGNYYWRVKSIDSVNHESEFSINGRFEVTGPVAPVLALPLNNELFQGTSTVTLIWNAADYAHSYRIQFSENNDFSVLISDQVIQTNNITTETLGIGRYFWRVKSINSHGYEGDYSAARFFNISGPNAPTLQLPSFGSVIRDTNTPILTWSKVNFAESYIVQISAHNNFASLIEQKNSLTTNAVTSALSAGNYFWRVKSVNSSGNESAFSEVGGFQIAGPLPPEEITSNWASNGAGYDVTLNWQAAEFANSYDVQIASDNAFTSGLRSLNVSSVSGMTNLEVGEYFARVRSINSEGIIGEWPESKAFSVGLFKTQIGGSGDDRAKQMLASKNGGYIILGATHSREVSETVDSNGDDWIFKIDEQGDLEWQFILSASGGSQLSDLIELSDGSVIAVGGNYSSQQAVALKLDTNGNRVWDIIYTPSNVNEIISFQDVVEVGDQILISSAQRGAPVCSGCSFRTHYYLHTLSLTDGAVSDPIDIPALTGLTIYELTELEATSTNGLLLSGMALLGGGDINDYAARGAFIQVLDQNLEQLTTWSRMGDSFYFRGAGDAIELSNGRFAAIGQGYGGEPAISVVNSDGSDFRDYHTDFLEYYGSEQIIAGNDGHIYGLFVDTNRYNFYPPTFMSFDSNLVLESQSYLLDFMDNSDPVDLVQNGDETFTFLINEGQGGNNNNDIFVLKRKMD